MSDNDSKTRLQNSFEQKSWTEIKASSSWQIFKIMAEFVEGFEKLSRIGPCVSIFGSARTQPDSPYYQVAEEIGKLLVAKGYGVITGGGPGIMEAGNKGAREAGDDTVAFGDEEFPDFFSHLVIGAIGLGTGRTKDGNTGANAG